MPVAGSIKPAGSSVAVKASGTHAGQRAWPGGIRRPQAAQTSRALHSGQSFQFSCTGFAQAGQTVRPTGASHTGHTFQVLFSGSPQAGQAAAGRTSGESGVVDMGKLLSRNSILNAEGHFDWVMLYPN